LSTPLQSDTGNIDYCGRGRPPILNFDDDVADPPPPLTPIERRIFDYSALEEAMAHLDAVVRQIRQHNLGALLRASGRGIACTSWDPPGLAH